MWSYRLWDYHSSILFQRTTTWEDLTLSVRYNHLAQLHIKRRGGWHKILWPIHQQFVFCTDYFLEDSSHHADSPSLAGDPALRELCGFGDWASTLKSIIVGESMFPIMSCREPESFTITFEGIELNLSLCLFAVLCCYCMAGPFKSAQSTRTSADLKQCSTLSIGG